MFEIFFLANTEVLIDFFMYFFVFLVLRDIPVYVLSAD